MNANAKSTLVSLVKEHATTLVREAVSVSRHCKRARVHEASDESSGNMIVRRRVHGLDVNLALQLLRSEKLYATNVIVDNDDPINKRIDLEDFLKQEAERLPNPPSELGIHQHWLAVNGRQPEIPQNPTKMVLPPEPAPESSDESQQQDGLQVNQLQSSLLSEELQLYFTRVTLAMQRGGSTADHRRQQDSVLLSLSRDAGLQELVPFLVRYCQFELYKHVKNAEHCRTLVRLANALLQNSHLHLELQLHELLPALMTCVVAKRLAPTSNHWALRREAATVLVQACHLFGPEYPTLKARVLRTLCDAVTPEKSLPSRYGGIVAITLFGPKAVDAFLLTTVLESWQAWEDELLSMTTSSLDLERAFEIQMCQRAILDALAVFLRQGGIDEQAERLDHEALEETLGDKWVICLPEAQQQNNSAFAGSEYAMCLI